uniref:Apolipophorins n=2 Tax=Drosophila melanogaster TaxID=7227 RepID=APLP_DROME|nr:apolipophorin, isoform B [Drosophila melanogaster]NP_001284720.1 apolipophorin, isoform C [Drosophila melanogaster]NP_001284721.1 apolipophorin, isoform D [Drosophila melanogaster]NP_524634.2 apolipophorin, isoform A [Drosophila melanogaster]Q9V496.2 RecName: Full=Apolipophorins; AltName: Full=Retinoid- and fatty acid-binding glycoprotein; Contains: RecName: Full=Apolipophorin-2; AltName: Full=ApoL2; AltName: Full=Apolipophorin II; Short=ApoLII; Contains: RecName: Full=Apolipophorin-1; AltNa|eukprot:NP_001259085.1 apolipophorin, isoform B [Drosophila melanogaster]
MARMKYNIALIGILASVLLTIAVNAENACNLGCPKSDNGLLKYIPGNYYDYSFDSILTIGASSDVPNDSDDTSLKVSGSAKIFAKGNCGYTLQLSSVKVTNTKESVEKKILNSIQKPVQFTLVSGILEPQICSDSSDLDYSLNIKRAVVSLLQSGIEAEHEVDVFGMCPTHTSTSKVGNANIITKARNLNSCSHREQINSGLVSGKVNEKAGITSSLLLQANYIKESRIVNHLIENVQLTETYKFIGNTKRNSDISAKVVTILKLKNPSGTKANSPGTGSTVRSLIFQRPETYTSKNINALKTILSDLVDSTGDYVKKETAKKFVEFIRLLRQSDSETLLELAAFPHPNKVLARKVYLDGLFRTSTAESARVILKQLSKFDEKEKLLAILSLNIVKSVDKETLNQAASQLLPNAPKELYIAVGNLVAKYCLKNYCQGPEIDAISKKFSDGLKHCKPNTKREEERIVYILKGLGNAKSLSGNTVAALSECASTGRSNRIRVAALHAFSKVKCEETLQSKSLELLKNRNEDSELRIEAYLSAISCPNAEVANQISEIVNSETVNQVGGFISSNLKAIRDSTDVSRDQQKYHLANIRVTKTFPVDYRRYSFNNEVSYKLESLGVGASTDYQIIYSQHGFLPRSSRINVTTEFFGTNYNVFEASVRQENVEDVLEYYLGPKGLVNKDFDEIVKLIEVGNNGVAAGGRARRSIVDDVSKISKKYKMYGVKNVQDLNLDVSLKLFGSELAFLSLGDNIPSSLDDIINYFSTSFEKAKQELSSFEKQFSSHHLFLDTDLAYPTSIGVPLELVAQGFAATKVDLAVSLDINAILEQNWQKAKYRLKFVPSVDINANVQIGFNAQVLSTGLRVVSSAHSATGSDITVAVISDGEGFNVDLELPREKLELINFNVDTELYVAEQDKQKAIALKGNKKNKNSQPSEICFNQLELVGLNICIKSSTSLSEVQAGNGNVAERGLSVSEKFHLSRPFNFAVYLTTERKFTFKGIHTQEAFSQKWKLDYSTPGSKVSHDTTVVYELGNKPKTFSRLSFDNSQCHFAVEGGINNDKNELVVYGQYEQDKEIKKSKIGFSKNGNEYKPLIEIQDNNGISNSINGYHADGKIVVKKNSNNIERYNFENFQVSNSNNAHVAVNGWSDVGTNSLTSELRISLDHQTFLIKENLKLENGLYEAGFFINDEHSPENIYGSSIHLTIADQSYALKTNGKAAAWSIGSDGSFNFQKLADSNSARAGSLVENVEIQYKNKQVGGIKIMSNFDVNKMDVDVEISREQKIGSIIVKYESNQRHAQDYSLEASAKINKHSIDVISKCDFNGNVYVVDNSLVTSWGTLLSAKGEIGQRYSAQDININIQGNVQISGKDKVTQWILKVIGTPDKTNSDFRISRDTSELIKLTSESQHPQDKISFAKLNLIVKNQLTAKGEFRVAKNGKGDFTASIDTLKTEPKHKLEIESKFHIQSPKYDIDASLTLDGKRKVHLKSENTIEKLKFSTKNIGEANDKIIAFEANGSLKGELRGNGEIQGTFIFNAPDGRVIDGSINRKISTNAKSGLSQGNIDAQLSDTPFGSNKKRSISLIGKLDRLNTKTKEFSANSNLVYTAFNGEKSEISYQIKQQPNGDAKNIDFSLKAYGNPLPQPFEIAFALGDYSAQHAVVSITSKYGEIFSVSANGNYNNNQALEYGLQANIEIPKSTLKSLEINSHGKVLKSLIGNENAAYNVEFFLDSKTSLGQYARVNTVWNGTANDGSYDFEAQTNNMESPLKFNGKYHRKQTGNIKDGDLTGKQTYVLNAQYGAQYVKMDASLGYGAEKVDIAYVIDSSFDSVKDIKVNIRTFKPLDDSTYVVTALFKQTDKSYGLDTTFYHSAHKKGVDIRLDLLKEKPIIISSIAELLGDRKGKVLFEILNLADLDIKINSEASYVSIDEFYIIVNWSSKKLKLDGYELEARAQSKNIKIQLKNENGIIFSGTATYALKKELNKTIIDGQGKVQYQGKALSGNFKLTRQHFDFGTDREVGFSYTFMGNLGSKNGLGTLKITNKEFNTKFSVCEEKRQCTNLIVQSIVSIDEQKLDAVEHTTLIIVDLRDFGYPYEFELKSQNTRQGLKYQYHLDSFIITGNNFKYQFTANVQPTSSTIKLALPKRQILFETTQKIPADGSLFGRYEQTASFFIDKLQKPDDVARFSAIVDVTGTERVAFNANGKLKFEHPTIRPLSISGQLNGDVNQQIASAEVIFDIFRLPEQKVVGNSELRNSRSQNGFNIAYITTVKSAGLQFQYQINSNAAVDIEAHEYNIGLELNNGEIDVKAISFLNKEKFEISLSESNKHIIYIVGDFSKQNHYAKLNTKVQILDKNPIEITSEVQPNSAKIILKRQDFIDGTAEVKLGKEFKVDVIGSGKQLFNGRVALDATNFLQTNYFINEDHLNGFWHIVESEINKDSEYISENIKERLKKSRQVTDKIVKLAKEAGPDFSKLQGKLLDYKNDIVQELEADQSIAPIIDGIRTLFKKIAGIVDDINKAISEILEKAQKSIVDIYDKLQALWKDSLLKAWEDFIITVQKLISTLKTEFIKICTQSFKDLLSALEKYGPALKNYGKAIGEIVKPINDAAQEVIKIVVNAAEGVTHEFKQYVASLPSFESIRNEFNDKVKVLKLFEKATELTNSLFDQINILPQTPETSEFLQKLHDYLIAKLKQEHIDNEKYIEELGQLLIKAVRSIWVSIRSTYPGSSDHVIDFQSWIGSLTHSFDSLAVLPSILSFRSSILNCLLNENWDVVFNKKLLYSWIFFNDFELRGHVVDGKHIFTFDGLNFAYPGNCKYILAQDSVDNNFTIIGQLTNGKLKSITLIDREGSYFEVADNLALKLNGNLVEYPQHLSGLHAWRRFYTIHLYSEYGVGIVCTSDLKVCHININGFYTSKTRGLLGNGNAEPYDDFLLIDGTLAENSAALGNDYGVGKCTAIEFDNNQFKSSKRQEMCSELFGIESTLAFNFITLDSRPYRKACDIALAKVAEKEKEATACTFALAYGSAVKQINKWVLLPPRCIKCAGPAGQHDFGDEFTVKLPNNKVDVVFVVDINVTPGVLSNLIAPAINDIRESLRSRGFSDVQVGVIVFEETKRYPALLTSDGGKINYKGNVADVKLAGIKSFCDNCVEQIITEKRILDIYNSLKEIVKGIAPQADEKAFQLALDYPFRAGAAKSIIGVRSDSLEYKNWWKFVRAQLTGSITKFDGALIHLIAPVKGLSLEGVLSEKLIGFNSRLVATVDGKDSKKRTKLQFDNDMGIDFVLNNGGWVFATQNFEKLKASDQKKMLNQITSSLADTLFKTEIVSDCRCLPIHGLHGQHKCVIKSSTFVANKKAKSA